MDQLLTPDELRDGIFALFTRRFGSVAEILIQRMQGFAPARARFHDLFDDIENKRVEVKFSRVLHSHDGSITPDNVLEAIQSALTARKAVPISQAQTLDYNCNIQQVKCAEFDVLYYGLFFRDAVMIFRCSCVDIPKTPGYSGKQHKGNAGEGQFHLSPKNYAWHKKHRFYAEVSYPQLLELLMPAQVQQGAR